MQGTQLSQKASQAFDANKQFYSSIETSGLLPILSECNVFMSLPHSPSQIDNSFKPQQFYENWGYGASIPPFTYGCFGNNILLNSAGFESNIPIHAYLGQSIGEVHRNQILVERMTSESNKKNAILMASIASEDRIDTNAENLVLAMATTLYGVPVLNDEIFQMFHGSTIPLKLFNAIQQNEKYREKIFTEEVQQSIFISAIKPCIQPGKSNSFGGKLVETPYNL